jgi:hypothetical protein
VKELYVERRVESFALAKLASEAFTWPPLKMHRFLRLIGGCNFKKWPKPIYKFVTSRFLNSLIDIAFAMSIFGIRKLTVF